MQHLGRRAERADTRSALGGHTRRPESSHRPAWGAWGGTGAPAFSRSVRERSVVWSRHEPPLSLAQDALVDVEQPLVEDPEVRFTNTGIAVTNLRVAVTQRVQQDGQWRDGDTNFFKVNVRHEA